MHLSIPEPLEQSHKEDVRRCAPHCMTLAAVAADLYAKDRQHDVAVIVSLFAVVGAALINVFTRILHRLHIPNYRNRYISFYVLLSLRRAV